MDYCSAESELIESLDYLTLPVKRSRSYEKQRKLGEHRPKRTQFLREYRKRVSHKTQTSQSLHKFNDSVVLNASKEETIEYYAIVSSPEQTPPEKFVAYLQSEDVPSRIKDQSVIKITVTPKPTNAYKSNRITRRKQSPKHIHNTLSNEDQSVQSNHFYLVVSGQKKEKHYIKTSESAKLLNDIGKRNDDISLEQVKNAKQILHSLNMDKKRKKGGTANKRTGSPSKPNKVTVKEKNERKGEEKKDEQYHQTKQAHSIVRITGQIGLGNDNQLMMRYGVQGTEAPAEVMVQTYPCPYILNPNAGPLLHTVSQGTQMDFGFVGNTQRSKAPYFTENVACLCKNINNFDKLDDQNQSYTQPPKNQSPLVVITVYPNDERCENVKIFKQQTNNQQSELYEDHKNVNGIQQINQTVRYQPDINYDNDESERAECQKGRPRSVSTILKDVKNVVEIKNPKLPNKIRSPRSESQSTNSSQNIKQQGIKKKDTNICNQKFNGGAPSGRRSPRSQSPTKPSEQVLKKQGARTKSTSPKNKSKNIKNEAKCVKNETKTSKNSPSPRSQSPSRNSSQNIKRQTAQNKRTVGESKQISTKNTTKEEKIISKANVTCAGTNTDHAWTKKTLVETFTREMMGHMDNKTNYKNPQLNESQVTISIDGEHENYDVLFQQGRLTTDLRVRKTIKIPTRRQIHQETYNSDENNDSSMINLYDIDNEMIGRVASQTPINIDTFDVPEIKVRDSIEIGHKRQHSPHTTMDQILFSKMNADVHNSNSFAPVKHHTNDKCDVTEPTKRDKEIRRLLGVDKHIKNAPMPLCKKMQTDRLRHHDHGESRSTKEIKKHFSTENKIESHQINFLVTSNKHSVGTQYEYEVQNTALDSAFSKVMLNRNVQVYLQVEKLQEQKPIVLSRKQYHKVKRAIEHTISKPPRNNLAKAKCSAVVLGEVRKKEKLQLLKECQLMVPIVPKPIFEAKDSVMFRNDFKPRTESTRQSVSSGDMPKQCSERRHDSSTKVTVGSIYSHSVHTIFRGFRKPCTPNLGTSTCSFYSGSSNEYCDSINHFKAPLDKPRKPFLKRLMSCLVLRPSTASEVNIAAPPRQRASCSNTVDSYYISTSMAAIEMSSSIYDTSESFYSNHSVLPIHPKLKRGFFGSVRGLLAYGRNKPSHQAVVCDRTFTRL